MTQLLTRHKRDALKQADGTKNLIVMRKGHFFNIDVIDDQGIA